MSFDNLITRENTNSIKYDTRLSKFGAEDIIPLQQFLYKLTHKDGVKH